MRSRLNQTLSIFVLRFFFLELLSKKTTCLVIIRGSWLLAATHVRPRSLCFRRSSYSYPFPPE